ncbi:hypothetical protein BS78_10G242300 [Paspalum vaginatum]|uniref:Uncharacterized protein n=1 Tax=Paspalum vaginatum TaxID=158149 RepID=A0A9W8CCU0_9POAL|nr:hypothetical protein BS78_K049400 [Paspalum vaginatum]KAJ1260563.1 hypothetical protein BS78_10G242300 [Paspalum vaginatum]
MALRSSSRTPRRDANSPPLTSQGGSSDWTKADAARKMEEAVEHLLAKLEKEGVEIDDKIASVVDDGIARIKAEAVRKNNEPMRLHIPDMIVVVVGSISLGFLLGFEFYANAIRRNLKKGRRD